MNKQYAMPGMGVYEWKMIQYPIHTILKFLLHRVRQNTLSSVEQLSLNLLHIWNCLSFVFQSDCYIKF